MNIFHVKRIFFLVFCCILLLFFLITFRYRSTTKISSPFKRFNLSKNSDNICQNVSKWNINNVQYMNKVWQYYNDGNMRINFLGAYYENRTSACKGSTHCVKAFPTFVVPVSENDDPPCVFPFAMFWYKGIDNPTVVQCQCWKNKASEGWHVNMEQYANGIFTCPLPDLEALPSHVSFTKHFCEQPKTFLKLHISTFNLPNEDVAVCTKSLFGKWEGENIAYLVSWLEALRIYGVKVVHVSYTSFNLSTVLENVIKHYTSIGFLVFSHIPNYLYETNYHQVGNRESQACVVSVINHCYGQIWNSYQYVMHIDFDEIIVPRLYKTYPSTIKHFCENRTNCDQASYFKFYSVNFYRYFPDSKLNPLNAKYVPLLQKLFRLPAELPGLTWSPKTAVYSKSIVNTRNCFRLHIHTCGGSHNNSQKFQIDTELALVHHYRGSCKYEASGIRCTENIEWIRRIYDPILLNTIGPVLQQRVRLTLSKSGYFD